MDNLFSSQFKVLPVADDVSRPLWSVMIPTYNSAKYLRETLASVLAQDYGSAAMQIMVVDDHSQKDDPEAIVKEMGNDRIEFYRQEVNVGHVKNFQTCIELSRGKLIHILHGDDVIREGFYQKIGAGFEQAPEIGAAFCRHVIIDENSQPQYTSVLEQPESGVLKNNWLELIAGFQRIQPPSIVVKREVYEKIGGFDRRFRYAAEDWEMWVRIANYYPVWYEVEPLAMYRKQSNSLTGSTVKAGTYNRDLGLAVEIFQTYLPKDLASRIYTHSKRNCAFHSLIIADSLVKKNDMGTALVQIREALRLNRSFRVVRSAGRIIILDGSLWLWRTLSAKVGNYLKK